MKKAFLTLAVMALMGGACLATGCAPGDLVAGFTAEPTSGEAPLKVQFTDRSIIAKNSAISGWLWDFGDGGTSTGQDVEHTYAAPGNYAVSLTVTSDKGKVNSAVIPDYIQVSSAEGPDGNGGDKVTILLPGNVPLELVRIPAGTFQMGSPDAEPSRFVSEGPVRTVNIGYEFHMGKYEVTQRQWLAVMGTNPGGSAWNYGAGDDYPAYYVSWDDAQAFITALNAHITSTGQGPATMRLPSESEWEYACRGGTQTRFYFGDSLGVADVCEDDGVRSQYMWYCGNNSPYGAKPVGGLLKNAFGLHDMSGNVAEWCEDWWHGDYTGAPTDGSAWVVPSALDRIVRGGEWYFIAQYARSANRHFYTPSYRLYNVGFRLVSLR